MTEQQALRRAYKASYNRPFITRDYRAVNMPLNSEYPLIRFLEGNGYDVSYSTCIDSARRGHEIKEHKVFISVGHDEYWARAQRDAAAAARDAGTSLIFFSGNSQYWKIRWEPTPYADGDRAAAEAGGRLSKDYRVMVCYKDSQSAVNLDPVEWTGTWRDARPINREGALPENELTGTLFTANAQRVDAFAVPYDYRLMRVWRNTAVWNLRPGETYRTFKGVLGHEFDSDIDNGFRPEGLIRLSETTVDNVQYIHDHGSVFDTGTAVHHLTLYRSLKSDALVWGTGMVQWVWGLDNHHDINDPQRANQYSIRVAVDTDQPDPVIRQATVNMLADMGVQPDNLQTNRWGLALAEASTDRTPPESFIKRIATPSEDIITVTASANDNDGEVAGCEVSFDAGGHWHPGTRVNPGRTPAVFVCSHGLNPWDAIYDDLAAFKARNRGNVTVMIRAIDDSCNMEQAHGERRGTHFDNEVPFAPVKKPEPEPVYHPTTSRHKVHHSSDL